MENKSNGLSIASMVLGIVSLVLWCAWPISIICSILGLVFGIIRLKKPEGKGMAIAGLVTSIIALVLWGMCFGLAMIGMMAEFPYYMY